MASRPAGLIPPGLSPAGLNPSGVVSLGSEPVGTTPIGDVDLSDVLTALGKDKQPRTPKIVSAYRVEDGHSATQNSLYWHLWRAGKQVKGSRSRFIQIGYGQLQSALGIDRSNIQDALRELQKKLSIRVFQPSTVGTATIYEVLSCEDILVLRRQKGMLWVRKFGTRRVDFVDEPSGPIGFPPTGVTPIAFPPGGSEPSQIAPSGGVTPIAGVGVKHTEPIGVAPIQVVKANLSKNPTSTDLDQLVAAILGELGAGDQAAALRIYSECVANAPDATLADVLRITVAEARRLRGNRRVDNPIGLLILQVPRRFLGSNWRGSNEPLRDQTDPAFEHWRKEQEAALEDPSVSEEEKRLIRLCLDH